MSKTRSFKPARGTLQKLVDQSRRKARKRFLAWHRQNFGTEPKGHYGWLCYVAGGILESEQ